LKEAAAKYKHRLEKLKKEKEALEAERRDLEHQLDEARSKADARAVTGDMIRV